MNLDQSINILPLIRDFLLGIPRSVKKIIVLGFDTSFCILSVWLSYGIALNHWGYLYGDQWILTVFSVILSIPLFIRFGLYRAIFRYIGSAALSSIAKAFAIYTISIFILVAIIGIGDVPYSIGVVQPIILLIEVCGSRYLARILLAGSMDIKNINNKNQRRALIYGAGNSGRWLASTLSNEGKIIPKGFIDDDMLLHGGAINGIDVYSSNNLFDLIRKMNITDVLLAMPSLSQSRINEIISSLYGYRVRVRSVSKFGQESFNKLNNTLFNDLNLNDLLGREVVKPNSSLMEKNIKGKVVLVTGAGGSIGSELCRQIICFSPKSLILIDNSEFALYSIYEELKSFIIDRARDDIGNTRSIELVPLLASVRDNELIKKIFFMHKPESIFHAAAYKHVPLVEQNPGEAILNNVFGTLNCAMASLESGAQNFTLISTDKAVRPTNIMGASKRIAELILQALTMFAASANNSICFSMVRFGNVLGSSGSVVPLFKSQIQNGGPVTLTHPGVTRYFMTISEAAQLVIQSSSMAIGGDVFILDMGESVRVFDLALKMIYLSGYTVKDKKNPSGDIEIKLIGLRPGEKLYEELLIGNNPHPTEHPKIMKAQEQLIPWAELESHLFDLARALDVGNINLSMSILKVLVPEYCPEQGVKIH